MTPGPCISLASCVGGGPVERLASSFQQVQWPGRVVCHSSPDQWRMLMASGPWGRIRARFGATVLFPLQAVLDAITNGPCHLVPTTNPFFLPLLLVLTRPLHRKEVVPLVYDLYPDALEAAGLVKGRGLSIRLAEVINRFWLRNADGIVFIGDRMAAHTRQRYGEPRRWTVIATGADIDEFERVAQPAPESELERWCEGKRIVSYVGNMGHVHDWDTLARGLETLFNARLEPDWACIVAAFGPGVEVLRQALSACDRVRFEPPLEDRQWARLLLRSQISLVTLKEEARNTSVPSKTFSAMAAGSAIVAIAPHDSDLADLVQRHQCGAVVNPGDEQGFVEAMTRLLSSPEALQRARHQAIEAVREHYDMPVLVKKWQSFLDR